jgi:hypothetical protein
MAIDKHLLILEQGIEIWNQWRDENPNIKPNLYDANLCDVNLSRANLCGVNFSRTDLSNANFSEANLSNANFSEANLRLANLSGAELCHADFHKANLSRANLCDANLTLANLYSANLVGAMFFDADLRGATLFSANLCFANFNCANLTGACIKDWEINSKTKLDKVICEYLYIDYDFEEDIKSAKRPVNRNFALDEFSSLYKQIIENTDFDFIFNKNSQVENYISNQGIKFYPDQKIYTWKNLHFRSITEIKIAESLDNAGVLFLPNCLSRLNTTKGRANIESDFLVCYKGNWGILEVDGESYHPPESRFKEQERERDLKEYGIKVIERFEANICYENPDSVVKKFFHIMEITYS